VGATVSVLRQARRLVGRAIRSVPWLRRQWEVSTDYRLIGEAELGGGSASGWFSPLTAWRQDRAYGKLLIDMHRGAPRDDLHIAVQAIDVLGLPQATVLEVGCGSGYYHEILDTLAHTSIAYTGVDFSPAMIARAKRRYPGADFRQMDGTALAFRDGAFDVAFNGVSLMHIPDWRKAVAESRRVAQVACIFHSVPVFPSRPTAHLAKYAYGAPVTETVFNRDELVACFRDNGLAVRQSWRGLIYDVFDVAGEHSYDETFLCVPA